MVRRGTSWEDIVEYGLRNGCSFGPLDNRLEFIHPDLRIEYITIELLKLTFSDLREDYNTVRDIFIKIYDVCKANNDDGELLDFIDQVLGGFILQR